MQYFVRTNLSHDGKLYRPGSQVELDDKQASTLLSAGTISQSAEDVPTIAPETVTESTPAEPAVGGKPQESGEPSIDTAQPEKPDTATDVTPGAKKKGKQEPENDPSENL